MAKLRYQIDLTKRRADGRCYVTLHLTAHGTRKRYSTGIAVIPEQWDAAEQKVTRKHPQWQHIEIALARIRVAAEEALLINNGESIEDIAKAIEAAAFPERRQRQPKRRTVIDIVKAYMSLKTDEGTRHTYERTVVHLERFRPDTPAEEVTRGWLMELDAAMAELAPSQNTRAIYMRNIRAAYNYAIDEGWIQNYPFRKYKIRTIPTVHRHLPLDDLRRLLTMEVEEWQQQYRDFFALSFLLLGINAKDLLYLTPDALQGDRLVYHRHKTKRLYSVKVEPEAMDIIERYRGEQHLINIMDTRSDYTQYIRQCNHALQLIGTQSRQGCKPTGVALWPKLSTYWARHTWATLASELDIPKETIAAGLGHGTMTVTDIYIDYNRRKVDEANRRVIDLVLGYTKAPALSEAGAWGGYDVSYV